MSETFDTGEFLADYLTESGEHLAALDTALLDAERLVGAGRPMPAERVNELFRAIHTLKGMAGMMGFDATASLAHGIEQVLDEVRAGARRLRRADLPVLFDGQDTLKRLHAALAATGCEAGVAWARPLGAIQALAAGQPAGGTASALLALLDEHEQMPLLVEAAKGQSLYEITVRPAEHCPEGLVAWLEGLGLVGRVPAVWDAEGRRIEPVEAGESVRLLLLTPADRQSVLDCTGVGEGGLAPARLPWEAAEPAEAPAAPSAAEAAAPALMDKATSIRVETARLDRLMELVGELVIQQTRVSRLSGELSGVIVGAGSLEGARGHLAQLSAELDEALQSVGRVSDALQKGTMRVRMVPVGSLFQRFPRILRDLAASCGKAARLEVRGGDTELDKTVIEQIGDPLIHLLRNAVDHGLETPEARLAAGKPAEGTVTLSATQAGHHIVIGVEDDGAGIDRARVLAKARAQGLVGEQAPSDADVLKLIFAPGFSTAAQISTISGRGVGMDVVHQNIQRLGGSVLVHSEPGRGTRFVIKLPLTLAIAKALLVRAGTQTFVIPLRSVDETLRLRPDDIKRLRGRAIVQVRGEALPVFRLSALFDLAAAEAPPAPWPAVIVSDGEARMAIVVDAMVGQQDVVVKSLGDFLDGVSGLGGATILGDGRVALILDVHTLLARHTRDTPLSLTGGETP